MTASSGTCMDPKNHIKELRGKRALERQLEYQEKKAAAFRGSETSLLRNKTLGSIVFRQRLEAMRPFNDTDRILEVGSGAHGLVFGFKGHCCVGVDPLAVDYKRLFPYLQKEAQTVAAFGEYLPFADASFDVVMSDNVIDHATEPFAIIDEILRVLKPGGLLYFTVNIHHPFYDLASRLYGVMKGFGVGGEVGPFADHTVHLTEAAISAAFASQPLKIIEQNSTAADSKQESRRSRAFNPDALLKKVFFKNARFELIALKHDGGVT